MGGERKMLIFTGQISMSALGRYLAACHLSGGPARAPSEDKICIAVVAVGGTAGGVSEGELAGIQTGNRL